MPLNDSTILVNQDDFEIVGLNEKGHVVCRNIRTGNVYDCDLTAQEFGMERMTPTERLRINYGKP